MGLDEYEPLRSLVVLKPSAWGRRAFDQIRQEFHWPVEDDQDASILLRVPYEPVNEGSITILEHLSPHSDRIWGVLGRLSVSEGAVSLYPLSLLSDTPGLPLIHLTLDEPKTQPSSWLVKAIRRRVRQSGRSYADPGADSAEPTLLVPVSEAEDLLLACAERGGTRLGVKEREGLKEAAERMYRQSLPILAAAFERLADCQDGAAAGLLRAVYLAIVHDQAAAKLRSAPDPSTPDTC